MAEQFEKHVVWLERYHRPIICTEFMRVRREQFDAILPSQKKHHVAAINWGWWPQDANQFPLESWRHPYIEEPPPVWFHESSTLTQALSREEASILRELTSAPN